METPLLEPVFHFAAGLGQQLSQKLTTEKEVFMLVLRKY